MSLPDATFECEIHQNAWGAYSARRPSVGEEMESPPLEKSCYGPANCSFSQASVIILSTPFPVQFIKKCPTI